LRRKENFSLNENHTEVKHLEEKIFIEILESEDDDYITKAQVLAIMKPTGW
jgi:hypothetical protein